MKKILILSMIISLVIIMSASFCSADYVMEIDYPEVAGVDPSGGITLVGYIRYIYLFALSLVGLAAVGVLIYGGFLYMVSGVNIVSQEEAKKWIYGALSGLVLALASYLILNTINPDLVRIREPKLPAISAPSGPATSPSIISDLQAGESCTPGAEPYCAAGLRCEENRFSYFLKGKCVPISGNCVAGNCPTGCEKTCSSGESWDTASCKCTASNP